MKGKRNNSSLIMLLSAINNNLGNLTDAVKEVGQQLQGIQKDLFEIRLDNLRGRGDVINHDRPK